ncbi:hypothetical protein JTB14_013332 [Gonioctena quinquepunctata]|nr:hypothetical protein JTB14_013332 [Gonioctena quinquepunctata]
MIFGKPVELAQESEYLGVLLYSKLRWRPHIRGVIKNHMVAAPGGGKKSSVRPVQVLHGSTPIIQKTVPIEVTQIQRLTCIHGAMHIQLAALDDLLGQAVASNFFKEKSNCNPLDNGVPE